ncbi:MAG: hypothetical protein ACSW8G_05785 [Bacillota bacterium]
MKGILFKTVAIAAAITMLIAVTGCGGAKVPERLVGQWDCAEYASDETTETGFYALTIEDNGTFSLYDTVGNPGISGTMKGKDTGKLGILELNCNEDDFDPPSCWSSLKNNSRIRYKIMSEDTIKLGYVGIWLTFTKSE